MHTRYLWQIDALNTGSPLGWRIDVKIGKKIEYLRLKSLIDYVWLLVYTEQNLHSSIICLIQTQCWFNAVPPSKTGGQH